MILRKNLFLGIVSGFFYGKGVVSNVDHLKSNLPCFISISSVPFFRRNRPLNVPETMLV